MSSIARGLPAEASFKIVDVTEFLIDGYKAINDLFGDYERARSLDEKQNVVAEVSRILTSAMKIEAEFLYPTIKKVLKEKGMISAAIMNHTVLKYLMSEIETIDLDSDIYDIKFRVLGEHVMNHFKETESRILSQVTECEKIDLWALGAQVAKRKQESMDINTAHA
jgi:hypothetical protein